MIEPFFWIIWVIWMLAAGYAVWNAASYLSRGRTREAEWRELAEARHRVVLIVAAKGFDPEQTPVFFESLTKQNYPDYRVILTFESEDDPAAIWAREHLDLTAQEVELVVAGHCDNSGRGQKVHNQIAAFERLRPSDEIVAFADADIRISADWLEQLVMPINANTHELSTTYRWFIPKRATFTNCLAAVTNAAVATMGGNEAWNMTWGGSMAIRREDFDELNVPTLFSGSLNDDLRLGKHARKAGRKIAFVRSLLIPTPIEYSFPGFIEFVRRQYYQVRHFAPILYKVSFGALWLYPLAFFSALAALLFWSYQWALIPLVVVAILDQLRAFFRFQLGRQLFGEAIRESSFGCRLFEHLGTPFWIFWHAVLAASACLMRRVTWAGITYAVLSPEKTRIISRDSI